jgi:hypothetical protein
MQIPCVYIPGPAPAVSVANTPAANINYYLTNGLKQGKTPAANINYYLTNGLKQGKTPAAQHQLLFDQWPETREDSCRPTSIIMCSSCYFLRTKRCLSF